MADSRRVFINMRSVESVYRPFCAVSSEICIDRVWNGNVYLFFRTYTLPLTYDRDADFGNHAGPRDRRADASGHRRRDRLRRSGAGPSARAAPARVADAGDRVAGHEHAAASSRPWRGSGTARSRRSIWRRCRPQADVAFLALPEAASAETRAAAARRRPARRRSVRCVSPARRGGADRRGIPATAGDAGGRGVRADRVRARRRSGGARLVANPGCYPMASLLARVAAGAERD